MPPQNTPRSNADRLPPASLKKMASARTAASASDFRTAIGLYKEVLAQHPDHPEVMSALGFTLGITGRLNPGLALLERALGADPGSADIRCKIARVRMLRVEPEQALEHLEIVTESEPRRLEALVMAAQCCERLNALDRARGFAERAVAVRRNDPEANLALAQIDAREKKHDDARARLEKIASKRTLGGDLHHRALTELGFVLDKLGEYPKAYDAFDRAGAEIAEMPQVKQIDRTLAYRRLDAYRGTVSRELVSKFEGTPFDTPAPAFLVGFPRSGTTMTEQVMAAHPAVRTSDELSLVGPMGTALIEGAADRLDIPSRLETLDAERVQRLRHMYWDEVREKLGYSLDDLKGAVFVDKLPLNIIDLPMLNTVFPDARVIVALRDPRDVCISAFMQWFAPNPAMIHLLRLDSATRFYEAVMSLYLEVKPSLGVPLIEVRYEDTVSDLDTQARRIIAHLGLPWDDGILRFHEKAAERAIRTPSYAAVTERVHTRAVARWRNYRAELDPYMPRLSEAVEAFGYTA